MLGFKVQPITQPFFETTLEVRIYDINYGRHLSNDSMVSLLHEARARFLKSRGFTEIDIDGVGIMVTNLVVNYLGQAFFCDVLSIKIALGEVSRTSVELIYQVDTHQAPRPIARALTTITFYDYEKQKVSRVPAAFLASLEAV